MKISRTLFLMLLIFSFRTQAQKVQLIEGSLEALKMVKSMHTEFLYDSMQVGKYHNGQDYVNVRTADLNKKQAGLGDQWAKSWVDDRQAKYEPAFNAAFAQSSGLVLNSGSDSRYTLIFKTTFLEPGFNMTMIAKENARINGEIWIVETADKSRLVARLKLDKAIGKARGDMDADTRLRIMDAYRHAGEGLGVFFKGSMQ